jgi:hypothetical protein
MASLICNKCTYSISSSYARELDQCVPCPRCLSDGETVWMRADGLEPEEDDDQDGLLGLVSEADGKGMPPALEST